MQKSTTYLIALLVIALFTSCKSTNNDSSDQKGDAASSTEEIKDLEKEGYVLLNSDISPADIAIMHSSAASILDYRVKEDEGKTWASLEMGAWEYEFIFDGEMSKPGEYEGHWIDFERDGTYEYGVKSEIKGGGKYHYTPNTGLLLLVDNNITVKPIEYNLKLSGDMMVFSGSQEYKDNGKQGRLKRLQNRPS